MQAYFEAVKCNVEGARVILWTWGRWIAPKYSKKTIYISKLIIHRNVLRIENFLGNVHLKHTFMNVENNKEKMMTHPHIPYEAGKHLNLWRIER